MECALSQHAVHDRRWRRAVARGVGAVGHALALLIVVAALWTQTLLAQAGARRSDRDRFTAIWYPPDSLVADRLLSDAVARDTFPWLPRSRSRIVIAIAPDAPTFRRWVGAASHRWTAAVTFLDRHRIVMQGQFASADAGDPRQVLRHELAHVALYDFLGDLPSRWFSEGYASYAAGEERTTGFVATNAALTFRQMPTLAALDTMLQSPHGTEAHAGYALALRAVSDLAASDRDRGLAPLFAAWKERGSFDLAMRRTNAQTTEDFERGWQRRAKWQFAFLSVVADTSLGGAIVIGLLVPPFLKRRRANRRRLLEMRDAEARSEHVARAEALDSVVRGLGPPDRDA